MIIPPVIIGLDPITQKFSGRPDIGVSEVWIPACAGMTQADWIPACAGMTQADWIPACAGMTQADWIPACAGMTQADWIPACAGMTYSTLVLYLYGAQAQLPYNFREF
jgi:hypothetical protein